MGFYGPQRRIGRPRDLSVRKPRAVTQAHTQSFRGRKRLQGRIKIDPRGALAHRLRIVAWVKVVFRCDFQTSTAAPVSQVEPCGDPADPSAERPLPPVLCDAFERREKGVLGEVVCQGRLGPKTPQERFNP